jgi:hypothetical protein
MSLPDASPFSVAAVVLGVVGALLLMSGIVALFKARFLRFSIRTLAGLLLLSLGALTATIALGIQGYRALTRETLAAQLSVKPTGPQRFSATLRFPDGRQATYDIAGDEIYVDARVLKWKPLVNVLGLHTAYELDRVAGRYRDIQQEKTAPRTVHALGAGRPVDLFGLRRRYAFLAPLLDAEYGSASFVPVTQAAELDLTVSTSGLVLRPAK